MNISHWIKKANSLLGSEHSLAVPLREMKKHPWKSSQMFVATDTVSNGIKSQLWWSVPTSPGGMRTTRVKPA